MAFVMSHRNLLDSSLILTSVAPLGCTTTVSCVNALLNRKINRITDWFDAIPGELPPCVRKSWLPCCVRKGGLPCCTMKKGGRGHEEKKKFSTVEWLSPHCWVQKGDLDVVFILSLSHRKM